MAVEILNQTIKSLRSVAIAASIACVFACQSSKTSPLTEPIAIKGEEFRLELAIDSDARRDGLKHRTSIPDHGGMLFVFPDDQVIVQRFWMHECLVDMDILFLDRNGRVTATHAMKMERPKQRGESEAEYQQRLPGYSSGYPAQFAIELKAGTVARLDVRVDDKIKFDLTKLQAMAH